MRKRSFSDETILSALMQHGSVKQASKELGCHERTIRNRLQNPEFKRRYDTAKAEMMRDCSTTLQSRMLDAIEVLHSIMTDAETAQQTRANCAQTILSMALRYAEATDILIRLDEIEKRLLNGGDKI